MDKWMVLMLLSLAAISVSAKKEKCSTQVQECNQSDYESYVECVRKRVKRNTDCDGEDDDGDDCSEGNCSSSCSSCDCNYCSTHHCENRCTSCCTRESCTTHHCCHKKCHAQCRTSGCRSSCRKSCSDKIKIIQSGGGGGGSSDSSSTKLAHNITTIIKLNNYINNTNKIGMLVNNTNINNITLQGETSQGGSGSGSINLPPIHPPVIQYPQAPCCNIISPRRCQPIQNPPFMKCFHLRSKKCGSLCSAPIMHEQPHLICDDTPQGIEGCHRQIVYIPQPKPRCWATSSWPYVNCGIQNNVNCDGCYSKERTSCSSSCFDDGFGIGPMYGQGPYYRSGFAPIPNCMQTGTCGYGFGGGMYPQSPYPVTPYDSYIEVPPGSTGNDTDVINESLPPLVPQPYPMIPQYPPQYYPPFSPYMGAYGDPYAGMGGMGGIGGMGGMEYPYPEMGQRSAIAVDIPQGDPNIQQHDLGENEISASILTPIDPTIVTPYHAGPAVSIHVDKAPSFRSQAQIEIAKDG